MPAVPNHLNAFASRYPEVWEAFTNLAAQAHEAGGPMDERTRRMVKLGIAIGLRHEGAVHSATRHAVGAGIPADEIRQTAILAITTIGWPAAYAALRWIEDTLAGGPADPL